MMKKSGDNVLCYELSRGDALFTTGTLMIGMFIIDDIEDFPEFVLCCELNLEINLLPFSILKI